jgi:hypothetical protein
MAQISVWKVTFTLQNGTGKNTSGPYNAFVGISGGSRGDIQNSGVNASLVTAITNNLLSILQAHGFGGSAAPGGTVTLDHCAHASVPDVWT